MTSSVKPKKWVILRGLLRGSYHWSGFDHVMKERLGLDVVVTPDLAGNGYRHHENSPTSLVDAVEQIREQAIKQIDLPGGEQVGVLGISLGAMIAAKWNELYPDEIACLVLANTSSFRSPFYQRFRPASYLKIFKLVFSHSPYAVENFILNQCCNSKETRTKYLDDFVQKSKKYPVKTLNLFRQLFMASQASFKKPSDSQKVLFLVSGADRLVNSSCTRKIAQSWGQAAVVHPWAGHDITLEDPVWVADQVKEKFNY